MRIALIVLLFTIIQTGLFSQEYKTGDFASVASSPVPSMVFPQFKGGKTGLDEYLKDSIIIPQSLSGINTGGVVVIAYTVNTKSQITKARINKVDTSLDKAFHNLILNALKRSGPWKPGVRNGKPFIANLQISFSFSAQ